MKRIILFISLLLTFVFVQAQNIRYVKSSGTGNGSSWANASGDIQLMIDYSNVGDQVWIAGGTYLLSATIEMKDGVNVYGGFAGAELDTESRQRSDLDSNGTTEPWEFTYATVLDGQNERRVLNQENDFTIETIWDGITITKGRTSQDFYNRGGGAYIRANTKLINSIIYNNAAYITGNCYGAGICNYGGTIAHCLIYGNKMSGGEITVSFGVGIHNYQGTVSHCIIRENIASSTTSIIRGGGIHNYQGTVSHCIISENSISVTYYNACGGGLYNDNGTISNCTVSGNIATSANNSTGNSYARGGGIYNNNGTLTNCTINENSSVVYRTGTASQSAHAQGGGIYNDSGAIVQCTINENSSMVSNNSTQHSGAQGGGIYNIGTYIGTVTNCTINNNKTTSLNSTTYGGGIYCYGNSHIIQDCILINNYTNQTNGAGGGIAYGRIIRCIIEGNSSGDGGGMFYSDASHCLLLNNNATGNGGGGYDGININCTFVGNTSNARGGGMYYSTITDTQAANCIFWNNYAPVWEQIGTPAGSSAANVSYSALQDGYSGTGNISITREDGAQIFADTITGNYGLVPCSPCTNVGSNSVLSATDTIDLAGMPRIYDNVVDMGAYEFQSGDNGFVSIKSSIHDNNLILATNITFPISHLWSTGETTSSITVTTPGTYWVKVSNGNGCTASDTTYVAIISDSICKGDSYYFHGANLTESGIYATTVESNTYMLNLRVMSVTISGNLEEDNLILNANHNSVITSCLWSTGETTYSITASTPGTYWLKVLHASGCYFSDTIDIAFLSDNVCEGNIYAFYGDDLTEEGVYIASEESNIYKLTLSVSALPGVIISENLQGDDLILSVNNTFESYLWNTGEITSSIIATTQGTYWVDITDENGCSNSDTINVAFLYGDICEGVSYNFYEDDLTESGTYIYSETSNIYKLTLSVNPLPDMPIISRNELVLTSSSPTGNQWYLEGSPVDGATQQAYTCTQNGNYYVVVTNEYECSSKSDDISIGNIGISEIFNDNSSILIYPNPTIAEIHVKLGPNKTEDFIIYNLTGQIISQGNVQDSSTINLSSLPEGVYYLKISEKVFKVNKN